MKFKLYTLHNQIHNENALMEEKLNQECGKTNQNVKP